MKKIFSINKHTVDAVYFSQARMVWSNACASSENVIEGNFLKIKCLNI